MNLKMFLAGLIGLDLGVVGYYMVGRSPSVVHHDLEPTTPTNVALLFDNDVIANNSYAAKSLMPQTPAAIDPGGLGVAQAMARKFQRIWLCYLRDVDVAKSSDPDAMVDHANRRPQQSVANSANHRRNRCPNPVVCGAYTVETLLGPRRRWTPPTEANELRNHRGRMSPKKHVTKTSLGKHRSGE